MPSRPDIFAPIVKADPSFGPAWEAFRQKWSGEAELPMHVAATMLARHLIAKLANNDASAFPAIFAVVEEWLSHPDRYVRRVADVGLIEESAECATPREHKPLGLPEVARPKRNRRVVSHQYIVAATGCES